VGKKGGLRGGGREWLVEKNGERLEEMNLSTSSNISLTVKFACCVLEFGILSYHNNYYINYDGGLVCAQGIMPSYKHRKDTAMSRTVFTRRIG